MTYIFSMQLLDWDLTPFPVDQEISEVGSESLGLNFLPFLLLLKDKIR